MAFPESKRVLICGRVGDPQCSPEEGSTGLACCDCDHPIMVSPNSVREYIMQGTPLVCVQCYARFRDEGNPTILVRQKP
jgi:hypothetical protein